MNEAKNEHDQEEWGGWKFVSEMLDNPVNGIYPTSKCYKQLYDFVVAQKKKAYRKGWDDNAKRMVKEMESFASELT